MKIQFIGLLIISSFLVVGQPAFGADLNVPEEYPTIEGALNSSVAGDLINISPGIYYEFDLTLPDGVTIAGMGDGPEDVVLNAQGQGRILLCEGLTTGIVRGITFTNGAATGMSSYDQSGGAILINNCNSDDNSIFRIINCRFINNSAEEHGGAIRCSHSSPQIINCTFDNNIALLSGGGAIDCSYDSSPSLENCFFKLNEAQWGGAISCRVGSSPTVYQCGFDRNLASGDLGFGGAIFSDLQALPTFQLCTFYGNTARYGGALASFRGARTDLESCTLVGNNSLLFGAGMLLIDSSPTINNTIFAFQDGSAIACGGNSLPQINCSDIFSNSGGNWYGPITPQAELNGNLSLDPLFCNNDPGDGFRFHLAPDSPCASQVKGCPQMGAWSANCEVTPTFVFDFDSEWANGIPRISWSIADRVESSSFVLKRSLESRPEDQKSVPFENFDLEHFVALDHQLRPTPGQNYLYKLYLVQKDLPLSLISEVRLSGAGMLNPLQIKDAWPNPFNPLTTIKFEVSQDRTVTAAVHNVRGQRIRVLAQELFPAGEHQLVWNGKDDLGRQVESGAYFIIVQSEELVSTQKVLLLK